MNPSPTTRSIMIVDDEPANLKLLEDMLRQKSYEVRSFPRGRLALAAAANQPPDLILLDVTMPEMDGYEVCKRLKSDPNLSSIPVIFLSALNETEDKVKAFQSGGVDYISKPFQFEEIYSRVETHLNLHHLQRALQLQNEHLEETVAARTRELADANQRLTLLDRAKDDFLKIISHELRTPLNGLLGVSEIVLDEPSHSDENNELRQIFELSRQRMVSLLDDALLLTEIDVNTEGFKSAPVSLSAALAHAVERTEPFAQSRDVKLEAAPGGLGFVRGDEDLLVRALHTLLEAAVKLSAAGGIVRLGHSSVPDSPRFAIESRGKTILPCAVAKFFEVFSIGEAIVPGEDFGLGPAVACRILSLCGGTVTVANLEPAGVRVTVVFWSGLASSCGTAAMGSSISLGSYSSPPQPLPSTVVLSQAQPQSRTPAENSNWSRESTQATARD